MGGRPSAVIATTWRLAITTSRACGTTVRAPVHIPTEIATPCTSPHRRVRPRWLLSTGRRKRGLPASRCHGAGVGGSPQIAGDQMTYRRRDVGMTVRAAASPSAIGRAKVRDSLAIEGDRLGHLRTVRNWLAVGWCAIGTVLLLIGCSSPADGTSRTYDELTFREVHPASGRPTDIVHIYAAIGQSGRIDSLYAITLRLNGSAILYETRWDQRMGSTGLMRDWTDCRLSSSPSTDPIPRTVTQLEASILGPERPPRGAVAVGPNTWQIDEGIAVLTVHVLGRPITERVVATGLRGARRPGTVIMDAELAKVASLPPLRSAWGSCRPWPRSMRPVGS